MSRPQISFIIPTRDRAALLAETLGQLERFPAAGRGLGSSAEVIVIDNASAAPARAPALLRNGAAARVIRLEENTGAAARNVGAEAARGEWLVMLDDDSAPVGGGVLDAIEAADGEVAAIGADTFLPDGSREAGGLPEVIVGCAAAIRRREFLDAGGYDEGFGYYVEEYDLCAKLLRAGGRVVYDGRFRALHQKATAGRNMNEILRRLVRNNGWVAQRYSPADVRGARVRGHIARYGRIALKERAISGYAKGLAELARTIGAQPRREMDAETDARFTGLDAARRGLRAALERTGARRVAIVDAGKQAEVVRAALAELGATIVKQPGDADAVVIGTLSPGPMRDSYERRTARGETAIMAWTFETRSAPTAAGAIAVEAA